MQSQNIAVLSGEDLKDLALEPFTMRPPDTPRLGVIEIDDP